MNIMLNHINYTEQGMIRIQDNFIESDNYRVKQSIRIDKLIRENIKTKKTSTNFITF